MEFMKRALIFLILFTVYAPLVLAHEGEDHSKDKKPTGPATAGPTVQARRADRTVSTSDGQFQFFYTQTPSDPRTGEEVQFEVRIVELVEGGFSGGQAPVEEARVTGQLKTAGGESVTQSTPAHKEGEPGVYGVHYTVEKQGDYKVVFDVVTSDGRKVSVDFPVAIVAAPVRYVTYVIDLLLLAVVGLLIVAGYSKASRSFDRATAVRRTLPYAIILLVLLAVSITAVHRAIPSTEPRAISLATAVTAPDPDTILIPKDSQIIFGIRTQEVKQEKIVSGVTVTGFVKVRPQFTAEVVPPVSGRTRAAGNFTVGSFVRQGQTLAIVEQVLSAPETADLETTRTELRTRTAELQAQATQALTRRNAAEVELARARRLYDAGATSLKRVQEAEVQLKLAEQELTGAQKQAQITKVGEERVDPVRTFPLQAPISGVIAQTTFTPGEQVEAGKALFTIMNLDRVWIEAQVFEKDLATITTAKRATYKAAALPDTVFQIGEGTPNRLLTVGASVDPEKRTVSVVYEVDNPNGKLRNGMSAEITIDITGDRPVISVPKEAVVDEQGRKFVYVYEGGERFEKRVVTVGSEGQTDIQILSGVEPGELVVVEGIYQLRSTAPSAGT
jgi:membrane fusion protein, heavy metal efflux system